MNEVFPFDKSLPDEAGGAVAIVRTLVEAGHQALLAGGCVRDLLLGLIPQDYDVATAAPPERVSALFRATRHVGAQFGVVLVKKRRRWIEVATFRADGPYLDGRRPIQITLSDARHDALRRDFTINGMFLDPVNQQVVDYVGGRGDLAARLVRAIGDPAQRFDEDYLRLLRAVRFAARLGFVIEPTTHAAIRGRAPTLAKVAAERVREELERMLAHPSRRRAWSLMDECSLLPYLWPGAGWIDQEARAIETFLDRLPPNAPFELALAVLLARRTAPDIEQTARVLTLSNEQRETTLWLVAHQADLDEPDARSLAELKRLMAHGVFHALTMLARARYQDMADASRRRAALDARLAAISPDAVQPPPLVTGDDLLARSVAPGPIYKEVLEALYTQQLNEKLLSRGQALTALDRWLRERRGQSSE
jgi:poly(A) polymerase